MVKLLNLELYPFISMIELLKINFIRKRFKMRFKTNLTSSATQILTQKLSVNT